MKNFLVIACLLLVGASVFTACQKDEIVVEEDKLVNDFIPRETVSNTLFIATLRLRVPGVDNCTPLRGTCGWNDGIGCDIAWAGDVDEGLDHIQQMDNADVLMDIETYEDPNIIGFRFKGFSNDFLEESSANGDDGSSFTVVENMQLNPSVNEALGLESVKILAGEYEIFTDPATGESVTYIDASLN